MLILCHLSPNTISHSKYQHSPWNWRCLDEESVWYSLDEHIQQFSHMQLCDWEFTPVKVEWMVLDTERFSNDLQAHIQSLKSAFTNDVDFQQAFNVDVLWLPVPSIGNKNTLQQQQQASGSE